MPSGSAAIEWSLRIAGVGFGDRVAVSAFDYPGVIRAVEIVGARPVLVDARDDRPTMDVDRLRDADSDATAGITAVVATHLYGHAVDLPALSNVCLDRGWTLIEDACQCPGVRIADQPPGRHADLATLSFGGGKPLSAGSGGAVLIRSSRHAAAAGRMIDRPSDAMAMSPLACATLWPQVERMPEDRRHRIATLKNQVDEAGAFWSPQADTDADVYKVPHRFADRSERDAALSTPPRGLHELGEPFRSAGRMSPRRVDRLHPTPNADRWADTLTVSDLPASDQQSRPPLKA